MARQRISFTKDRPVDITLDETGKPTPSTNREGEPEFQYFLTEDRIMWVPPAVHDAIQRAQAGEHASFALTKHTTKPWSVVHLEDEPPAAQTPTHTAVVSRPRAAQTPTQSQPEMQSDAMNGSQALYACLCAAIRTAHAAEAFALKIGRPLVFQAADISAMGHTLYIQHNGGGR
jgi:hypothetical protein